MLKGNLSMIKSIVARLSSPHDNPLTEGTIAILVSNAKSMHNTKANSSIMQKLKNNTNAKIIA